MGSRACATLGLAWRITSTSLPGITLPTNSAGSAGAQSAASFEFAGLSAAAAKVSPGFVPTAS